VVILQPGLLLLLKPVIPYILGLIIFCIGINTPSSDFKILLFKKSKIIQVAALKFITLPILSWILLKFSNPPSYIYVGMMLLSASPGGTAACVMSHIAGANVSLNIALTIITTLLTPIALPIIAYISLNNFISVDFTGLFLHLIKIIFIPLAIALYIRSHPS
jgi:BASS family bile acid:Na+ symporter